MTYKVLKIEEDVDFGCEERPEGVPVMAVLTLLDEDGTELVVRHPDEDLYRMGIREGDRIFRDPQTGEIIK